MTKYLFIKAEILEKIIVYRNSMMEHIEILVYSRCTGTDLDTTNVHSFGLPRSIETVEVPSTKRVARQ